MPSARRARRRAIRPARREHLSRPDPSVPGSGLLLDADQAGDRVLVPRSLMAKLDWMEIAGIATVLLSAGGLICVLLFIM